VSAPSIAVAAAQAQQAMQVVEALRGLTRSIQCDATRLRAEVHVDMAAELVSRVHAAFVAIGYPDFAQECLRRVSPTAAAQLPAMDPDSFAAAQEAISRG
jgi:hypothetical protein